MKKILPDPSHSQHFRTFCSINPDVSSREALLHTLRLMSGIEATLEEYICANAGEAGMGMLVNTVHQLQMTQALTQMVLQRSDHG